MNTEQLHAYFDGELTPAEAADVERALDVDPGLAAEFNRIRATDFVLGTLPGLEVGDAFTAEVLRRAARVRRGRIVAILAPLAVAAAVLVAVVFSGDPAPDGHGPTLVEAEEYTWELDMDTYGSLAVGDLESEILKELEAT